MARRSGSDAPSEVPPSRRRPLATGALAAAALAAALLAAEAILRARDFAPWTPDPGAARVEPGGSLYRPDPALGYALRTGAYEIALPTGLRFRATHDAPGHRATSATPSDATFPARPEIWIFGDSFTYGWSVNDAETYPWRLQAALPGHRVVNFGVGGYGTLHALLQLREALRTGREPALVLLAHNFFLDPRNTFSRLRRREVAPSNRLGPIRHPWARAAPDGSLRFGSAAIEYREVPGMRRSSLANAIATAWDVIDDRRLRSHAVTRALLGELIATARARGIPVLVTTLEASPADAALFDFARAQGAQTAEAAVDMGRRANTNLPHDGHPSARAQRRYAERLAPALRAAIAQSRAAERSAGPRQRRATNAEQGSPLN